MTAALILIGLGQVLTAGILLHLYRRLTPDPAPVAVRGEGLEALEGRSVVVHTRNKMTIAGVLVGPVRSEDEAYVLRGTTMFLHEGQKTPLTEPVVVPRENVAWWQAAGPDDREHVEVAP